MGKFHFWVTFLGAYAIFFPMHYLGLVGVPRRYYDIGETAFIPDSAHDLNAFISVAALVVGFAQMVFLFNLFWSLRTASRPAQSLARHDARMADARDAARHGNWGKELPVVYRWAYDYSVPGAPRTSSRRTGSSC
jgi:cytochrome c oxidase subunit I